MATVPIVVAAVLPAAIDLLKTDVIPWAVKLIDHVLGGKTAANPTVGSTIKFPIVATLITGLQAALVALGKASPSTDATVQGAIQEIVTNLQNAGVLTGHTTVVTSAPAIPVPGLAVGALAPGPANLGSAIEVLQWLAAMPASLSK